MLLPILSPHTTTMDFTMALPESTNGFDTLLAVMCKFSKKNPMLKPCKKTDYSKISDAKIVAEWKMENTEESDPGQRCCLISGDYLNGE